MTENKVNSTVKGAKDTARTTARTAARKAEAGRRSLLAPARRTTRKAVRTTAGVALGAWKAVRAQKAVAAGAGIGAAVAGACYAAGRRSAAHHFGPVTRLTGGRV